METTYKIPDEFCAEAKQYMADLLVLLGKEGIINNLDTAALTLLGDSYNKYLLSQEILLQEGIVVRGKNGEVLRAHPAVKICHDSEVFLTKLLLEFGLTPKRRQKTGRDKPKEDLSPIENFINSKREIR